VIKEIAANHIRHVSLDFWNTIAFSNPEFKKQRANVLVNEFRITSPEADQCFTDVGEWYNHQQESLGIYISPLELMAKVVGQLAGDEDRDIVENIYRSTMQIFREHPPLINKTAQKLISEIVDHSVTLSILSNTAFIPGWMIGEYLENVFNNETFSFFLFSDQAKTAKPRHEIFEICYQEVLNLYGSGIEKKLIMHIGDHEINDLLAARSFGFSATLINNYDIKIPQI
jgi:FMN phosphatase YigB (HAD superfamily)